ncbi:probable F-box protein At4g22060 [Lycium barbarum]|uniref:probable F-box protein At4g22060 n=1 Tax=Lycium barbarum TaxID=112863 RepID=UPI00293E4EFC|nr:probable F-box protein At4g22060 [Lycium barbarum]
MADWAGLPHDLLVLIAKRVKLIEDFIALSVVCTSWQTASPKDNLDVLSPQLPLLMLADKDDDYREFYSLSKGKVSQILCLPEARGRACFPSETWLVTMAWDGDGELNLLHPFSRTQIQLPSQKALWDLQPGIVKVYEGYHNISKAVLSANPSLTSDYVLVISYNTNVNHLAFWRPRDLNWNKFDVVDTLGGVSNMIYYKGQFVFVTWPGEVCILDVPGPNTPEPTVKSRMQRRMEHYNLGFN